MALADMSLLEYAKLGVAIATPVGGVVMGAMKFMLNGSAARSKRIEAGVAALDKKFETHIADDRIQFGEIQRAIGRVEGQQKGDNNHDY